MVINLTPELEAALSAQAQRRGIAPENCIADLQMISSAGVAELFDKHDQIWHW